MAPSLSLRLSPDLSSRGKRVHAVAPLENGFVVSFGEQIFRCSGPGEPLEVLQWRDPNTNKIVAQAPGDGGGRGGGGNNDVIRRLFPSDCHRHCLVQTEQLHHYYVGVGSTRRGATGGSSAVNEGASSSTPAVILNEVKGLRKLSVTAVGWCDVPFAGSTEISSCHAFVGLESGALYLVSNFHDFNIVQVRQASEDVRKPITDLRVMHTLSPQRQASSASGDQSNTVSVVRYTLWLATQKRLLVYNNPTPLFLDKSFVRNFDRYFVNFFDSVEKTAKEVPAATSYSRVHHLPASVLASREGGAAAVASANTPAQSALYLQDSMAWVTTFGLVVLRIEDPTTHVVIPYAGPTTISSSTLPGSALVDTEGVVSSLGASMPSSKLLGFASTEYHFLVLFGEPARSLVLFSRVTAEVVYAESLPVTRYGELVSVFRTGKLLCDLPRADQFSGQILLVCDAFVYDVTVNQEKANVWRLLLKKQDFSNALKLCDGQNKFFVIESHAEALFREGDYGRAAIFFSQLPSWIRSFESICLAFLECMRSSPKGARLGAVSSSVARLRGKTGTATDGRQKEAQHQRHPTSDRVQSESVRVYDGQHVASMSSPASAAVVALALLDYLKLKMQNLAKGTPEPQTQMVLLGVWGIEFCLNILCGHDAQAGREAGSCGGQQPAASSRTSDGAKLEEVVFVPARNLLLFFLNQAARLDCAATVYQLLLSYDCTDEFLYFAWRLRDFAMLARHYVARREYPELLECIERVLVEESEEAAVQILGQYAPILFEAAPVELVSLLRKPEFNGANVELSLGLLASYAYRDSPTPDDTAGGGPTTKTPHAHEAIRYLEFALRKLEMSDLERGEYLKLLFVFYARQWEGDILLRFLQSDDVARSLDLIFALRVLSDESISLDETGGNWSPDHKAEIAGARSIVVNSATTAQADHLRDRKAIHQTAQVLLFAMLGHHEEAVEAALASGNVELAKEHAARPAHPEERTRLFLQVVEYEADRVASLPPVEQLSTFRSLLSSHGSGHLVTIRDLLPFVPEPLVVSGFQEEIAQYLENCERSIDELRTEMREHRKAAQVLKKDLQYVSERTIELRLDAVCELCGGSILEQKFVCFLCGHAFHLECAEKLGLKTQEDCPSCGYQMIDAVVRPFIAVSEEEETESWKI
ncbi:unnamed protein product [Amoebophrya sp. A120]|nr:unnamed protein product [Amoebophrya sp. A120]|eukprot:GSA120T00015263001.1